MTAPTPDQHLIALLDRIAPAGSEGRRPPDCEAALRELYDLTSDPGEHTPKSDDATVGVLEHALTTEIERAKVGGKKAADDDAKSARITPWIGPGTAGVGAMGRF